MRDRLTGQFVRQAVEQVRELAQESGPRRVVDQYEIDRLRDRVDARGVLIRHLDAVGVLQLLHERVEVQRVSRQVLAEVRGLLDPRGIQLQLVREMLANPGQHVVTGHGESGTLAAASDAPSARRSAPAASRRACVRPATSSRTPRAATSIARVNPCAPNEPCGTTARRRRPSRTAPPCSSGSISLRSPRSAGLSSRPPTRERSDDIAAPRTAPSSAAEVPSITFSATLPVKPSATITSATPVPIAKPSTLPMKPGVPSSAACAASTFSVPRAASVPLESSATRGEATPRTASMNAAPMCANWTRCSGRTSTLAPASKSRNGAPGTGTMMASAGRCTPRARLNVNSDAASAAPVEPPLTSASASPSATARTARTIEESGLPRTARAGSGSLAIETGASTTSTPGTSPSSAAGPYRITRIPPAAARAAPRATSTGPLSAPLTSTATVTGSVVVIVIVVVHVHDLAPGVEPAMRADPVRTARPVALRAAVHRRSSDLVLCPALRGARVRLLLLGNGHRRCRSVADRARAARDGRGLSRTSARKASPSGCPAPGRDGGPARR